MRQRHLLTIGWVLRLCLSQLCIGGSLAHASLAQSPFRFSLPDSARTSAGIYKQDGTLVRTLWSGVTYGPGTYSRAWDGTDDEGRLLPDDTYQVKVLSNRVAYAWEGVIGNTSETKTGPTYLSALENIACMAVSGTTAYYGVHYNEQKGSCLKLNTTNPRSKTDILGKGAMVWLVATDGKTVYWGGADPNKPTISFLFATSTATDADVSFSAGVKLQTSYGRAYPGALSVMDHPDATLSGLAVQPSGRFLILSRQRLNKVYVLDKQTGALVQTTSLTAPRAMATDPAGNVWLITGTNTVQHYTLTAEGSLQPDGPPLAGLTAPLSVAVSPDGATLVVCDGGASQQVKAYDSHTRAATWTLGEAGGYATDPAVSSAKFYFSDFLGSQNPITAADVRYLAPFVAFGPTGSFWVNDPGNNRVLHYSADRTYLNQVMAMTGSSNAGVDRNNPSRVFSDFLEFQIDYTKPLDPTNGSWTLVKNWGAIIPRAYDANIFAGRFRFVATLSNGRTYSVLTTQRANRITYEVVELPASGPLRFTGIQVPDIGYQLYPDGSLRVQSIAQPGQPIVWQKQPLLSFDALNNPQWGPLQPIAQSPPYTTNDPGYLGNPTSLAAGEITSSDIVVAFDGGRTPRSAGTWYHLGGIRAGSNTWLWRTAPSSSTTYSGDYPTDGAFDIGNGVNNAGSRAIVTGRHIFWGYYGEFWKGTQTNKWQHVYDNGLFVGQFGKTGRDGKAYELFAGMTGNAYSATIIPSPIDPDVAYLYHNDDGWHCGVHRWRISGLNTIREQTIPLSLSTPTRGLRAEYFDGRTLDNAALTTTRLEASAVLNQPNGPADTRLKDVSTYSLRWRGFIQPLVSGQHTFYVKTNGKTRLWVDGKLLLDQWTNADERELTSVPVELDPSRRYDLRLEYAPTRAAAQLELSWAGNGLARQVIPSTQLTPAELTAATSETIDLLAYLEPGKVLETNLYGWQRTPLAEDYADPYRQWWSARTGFKSYGRDRRTSSDVWAKSVQRSGTYTVSRTLSVQTDTTQWQLTGAVYYDGEDGNKPNASFGYADVLDDQGRVIVRLQLVSNYPSLTLYANKAALVQQSQSTLQDILYRVQPLDVRMNNRVLTVKYGPFPSVTAPPFDSTANWQKPRTLRLLFQGNADGTGHAFGIERMQFRALSREPTSPPIQARLGVYPNPSPDWLTVTFPAATELSYLDVLSATGQRLFRQVVMPGSVHAKVDVIGLSGGIYFLSFYNSNTKLSTRFFKQ